jgi:hypothetical protein
MKVLIQIILSTIKKKIILLEKTLHLMNESEIVTLFLILTAYLFLNKLKP